MSISANYSMPILVNGYSCKNCTDVDYAKKHIDPEHPKAGPYGINAKNDPTLQRQSSVTFGGSLSNLNKAGLNPTSLFSAPAKLSAPGNQINLLA